MLQAGNDSCDRHKFGKLQENQVLDSSQAASGWAQALAEYRRADSCCRSRCTVNRHPGVLRVSSRAIGRRARGLDCAQVLERHPAGRAVNRQRQRVGRHRPLASKRAVLNDAVRKPPGAYADKRCCPWWSRTGRLVLGIDDSKQRHVLDEHGARTLVASSVAGHCRRLPREQFG